jgi:hypothetical protein
VTPQSGGSQVVINGNNGIPDWFCYLMASTNQALPVAQWQVIATNMFDGNGNASFTNTAGANPWQFYLLKL